MSRIADVPPSKYARGLSILLLCLCVQVSCVNLSPAAEPSFPPPTILVTATIYATPTPQVSSQPVITNTPEPTTPAIEFDGVWRPVKPGIDYILLQDSVNGQLERLVVARVDPNQANFRVLYDPESPRTVREWHRDAGADLAINGGFFDQANRALGLLISDGQAFGQSFRGFGGMFSLRGDRPALQWLKTNPYRPDAGITQAAQSFPMLVLDSHVVDGINDNGERNRRSFVALDKDGSVLLGVCQTATWTLTDLAQYLAASSRFNVAHALNLDGGASTGIWIKDAPEPALSDSFEAVPSVVTISGR
jgi:uncharacterized protein YigE (DUF2233 family)